ncbi:MAG TPA: hypothetical protein VJA16_22550, partial [Thermoanaerobaculia bacterium]
GVQVIADFSSRRKSLWFYHGPCEGVQTIGIEIMRDTCWRCHASLDTVTGIVFPDREVSDWSRPDWTYYQALLPLARIPDAMIPALSAAVEAWRAAGDRRLTVIRWRYSKTVEYAYWAAECSACGSFRGDFPVMEARLEWLNDLESRRMGILSYRPLRLDVPREALQELTWGGEVNPHVRFLGWYRTGDAELDSAVETGGRATGSARAEGSDGLAGMAGPRAASGQSDRGAASGPDLSGGRAIRSTVVPAFEAGARPRVEPARWSAASALPPGRGPAQRLGKILSACLGWMAARRRPPGRPETEVSEGPPMVDGQISA